jgi:hypothetical protein
MSDRHNRFILFIQHVFVLFLFVCFQWPLSLPIFLNNDSVSAWKGNQVMSDDFTHNILTIIRQKPVEREYSYSSVPVIWHSVSSDVPCRNAPFYQQWTQHVAEWITLPHRAPTIFYVFSCYRRILFKRWRDLAAKKRKEAQKQIPITNFLKK